jgi:hypothetical protein
MPFACAKAVCATFCSPIAGALIPIFGPDFPSQCISPGAPDYGRMAIDPAVVTESAREAEMFRRMLVNANAVASNNHLPHHHSQQIHHYSHGPALPSPTSIPSPRLARRGVHQPGSPYDYDRERVDFGGRMRLKSGLDGAPYGVVVDSDQEMHSGPDTPPLHQALHRSLPYSPMSPPRSSGWAVANHAARPHSSSTSSGTHYHQHGFREELPYPGGPNPLLSAIPRFGHHARLDHYQTAHRLAPISQAPAAWNAPKRPAPEVDDANYEYDGQSGGGSPAATITTITTTTSRASAGRHPGDGGGGGPAPAAAAETSGAEKNAALLLMNLSVRDIREVWGQGDGEGRRADESHGRCPPRGCGPESVSMSPVSAAAAAAVTTEGHRSKRRRATSM